MTQISAQVSLYPIGTSDLAPAVEVFVATLRASGFTCHVGPMSTLVYGDDVALFEALQQAFREATRLGPAVLQLTVSNVCPLPPAQPGGDKR